MRSIRPVVRGSCGDELRYGVAATRASTFCDPFREPLDCRAPRSGGRVPVGTTQARCDAGHGIVVSIAVTPIPRPAGSPMSLVAGPAAAFETSAGVATLDRMAHPNGGRRFLCATSAP